MTYAGTNKGGTSAIVAAERLLDDPAFPAVDDPGEPVTPEQVIAQFAPMLDRLQGEAGLWDARTAAIAFLQAGGDLPEAVHLLRAHRSTLPRLAFSVPVDPDHGQLLRRIVSAHRSPDGPQLLGATPDYTARLLRRDGSAPLLPFDAPADANPLPTSEEPDRMPQRYTEYLRARDLLAERPSDPDDPEPYDLALNPIRLPAGRSAMLSAMALGETGGLVNLWYRSILGPDGYSDESITLGEVRHVRTSIEVTHPVTGEPTDIGELRFTECETVAHLDERGEDPSRFEAGYGLVLGHNERKAISMSAMDLAAHRLHDTDEGTDLQQLLMHTTDGLASNGFLEHLKLPHYVTFRSMLDRAEAAREVQTGHRTTPSPAAPTTPGPTATPIRVHAAGEPKEHSHA